MQSRQKPLDGQLQDTPQTMLGRGLIIRIIHSSNVLQLLSQFRRRIRTRNSRCRGLSSSPSDIVGVLPANSSASSTSCGNLPLAKGPFSRLAEVNSATVKVKTDQPSQPSGSCLSIDFSTACLPEGFKIADMRTSKAPSQSLANYIIPASIVLLFIASSLVPAAPNLLILAPV